MKIEGKRAVITGGGAGIGRAIALRLVSLGAFVVVADIDQSAGLHTLQLIQELSSQLAIKSNSENKKRAVFIRCDVTDSSQLEKAMDLSISEFGGFDIMLNNAGIGVDEKPFFYGDSPLTSKARSIIDINLTAVIFGTHIAIQKMKKHNNGQGGVIINVASMGGLIPMNTTPIYGATKSGVIHFTKSLASLSLSDNIRINVICPAYTTTQLFQLQQDNLEEEERKMLFDEVGGILTVEKVAEGMERLITDSSKAGAVMRVTFRKGIDFWPPSSSRSKR